MNISVDKTMVLRPYGKPYVVFGVIWGGMSAWILVTIIRTGNPALWSALEITLPVLVLFWAWISLHSIKLDNHAITYNALMPRSVMALLSDISRVEMRHISLGNKLRSAGLQSVIIHCSPHKKEKPRTIVVNARLFDNDDLEKLARHFEELGVKVQRY